MIRLTVLIATLIIPEIQSLPHPVPLNTAGIAAITLVIGSLQ